MGAKINLSGQDRVIDVFVDQNLKGFLVGPSPTSDSNVSLFSCYIKCLTPHPPLIFFLLQSFTVLYLLLCFAFSSFSLSASSQLSLSVSLQLHYRLGLQSQERTSGCSSMKENGCSRKQGAASPCAACKLLRRRCAQDCVFSPYFPADEPQKFANVHKVFGASNVNKMLQVISSNTLKTTLLCNLEQKLLL